jgi:diguanylate cyclase (GGDEF)-like protein
MVKNDFSSKHIAYREESIKWRSSLLLGLVLIFAILLPAQKQDLGSPLITNYQSELYQARSQNWVVLQDRRGVMYFGNSNGILEFDGQHWQLIPVPGDEAIRSLASGPDGTIYYGSIGELGYLTVSATGKVSAVSLKEAIPKAEQAFNDVWQAESCKDGIYFLTRSSIFRFHGGKITALPGKFASSQACALNGTLFYADLENGICLVDGNNVVPLPQLAGVFSSKRITLSPFGRHELLVGRVSGDFLHINISSFWDEKSQRYDITRPAPKDIIQDFPCEFGAFLKDNNAFLYKLVPLGLDSFAISTLKAGIITFNRAGKILQLINKDAGLLDNAVYGLLADRSNNLWAATNSNIAHIELSVPQSIFGERNGIEGVPISTYFHKGRLYVGTFQNLFVQAPSRFTSNPELPKFVAIKDSPNAVWQLLEVDGDLMAIGIPGLFRIEGEMAIKVPGSSASPYCIGTSRQWPSHLFMGFMGGLEVFKRTSGQWTLVGKLNGIRENIHNITEDAAGNLWLSTEVNGLLRAHFSGSKPTEVMVNGFGPEQGLPGITNLHASFHDSILYVASLKGLFSASIQPWNASGTDQTQFTPDLSLGIFFNDPPTAINNMVAYGKNGFIFSTAKGVVWAFPGKDGNFRMNTRPFQGLPPPNESLYVHPDGSVWLPGNVLHRVDPRTAKDYDQPFAVLVRKVIAKSKRLLFEGTHGYRGSAFGQQRTMFKSKQDFLYIPELPYKENALSFEFAAAFYEKPGTTQFQYFLEGFDMDWSEWTLNTSKEYTNLPEGKYSFRVRAKNLYGTMGREAVYSLRILPPWYRTWWAYVLWVTGGLATLIGIIYLYTLRLRREKAQLENIVAERTQQLRDASLTDPLTGLRNRRFILEVLQSDISAFIKHKHYLLNDKTQRRTTEEDTVFGVFIMDIDFFKKVNDTYGHDAGDRVLKQFSTILSGSVRLDDAVMRVGGEEFLVLLKKTKPEYLPVFAAKVLKKVAAMPFDIGGGTTIQKTCSIGYTSFPFYKEQPGLLTFEQSIMVADLGLFHAKNHGRNQGVYIKAGPQLPSGEDIIQKTVTSLEFALQEGYLQIDNVIERK